MHKIIVAEDSILDLKDVEVTLRNKLPEITLNIKGTVKIDEIKDKKEKSKININLAKNSKLIFNRFGISSGNLEIEVKSNSNSKLIYNQSSLITNKYDLKIKALMNKFNNNNEFNIKFITIKEGSSVIDIEADITKKSKDNVLLENVKILNLNNKRSTIIPNILIGTSDVQADHKTSVSSINKNDLFYLNSKGISTKAAIELICDGFLLENLKMMETNRQKVKEILISRR